MSPDSVTLHPTKLTITSGESFVLVQDQVVERVYNCALCLFYAISWD